MSLIENGKSTLEEEVALDTLSVMYLHSDHAVQFYILEGKQKNNPFYSNFLYVVEPVEDTESVIGAGVICVSKKYTHALLFTVFPTRLSMIIPIFLFP